MKKLLLLIILSTFNLYSQQQENKDIILKVHVISPCDSVPRLNKDYMLNKIPSTGIDSLDFYFPDTKGITKLHSPGKYELHSTEDLRLLFEIEIKSPGVYEYKRYIPRISHQNIVSDAGPHYLNCGELCEGYNEDFYENGIIRIRGTFKKGYPKDSLIEFYPNGKIKSRRFYTKRYASFKYDSLGNLESSYWSSSRNIRNKYQHSKSVNYYSHGNVKFEASDKRNVVRINCFYPDGTPSVKQEKKYRIEYYENGSIKNIYKWKRQRDEFDEWEFIITVQFFNEKGELQKTEKQTEGQTWRHLPQPSIAYTEIKY